MKSTLEAGKTASVHRLFGASNYVNRADKAEKFSGNSSVSKWKNRKITTTTTTTTTIYPARREKDLMGIELKHYMCS